MRITGGEARGRQLTILKGVSIRPTSDKVREAIFDLIGQEFSGEHVLDLFSGTGALGIEALSRGASTVLFIDSAERALMTIRKNLKLCGYERRGFLLKRDLHRGLPSDAFLGGRRWDLVFLDPPYGKGLIPPILAQLSEEEMLMSPAIVVAETSLKEELPDLAGRLCAVRVKTYGQSKITIFRYEDES